MRFCRVWGLANAQFKNNDTIAKFTNLIAQLIDELM
jgi:hypothetical protein